VQRNEFARSDRASFFGQGKRNAFVEGTVGRQSKQPWNCHNRSQPCDNGGSDGGARHDRWYLRRLRAAQDTIRCAIVLQTTVKSSIRVRVMHQVPRDAATPWENRRDNRRRWGKAALRRERERKYGRR